MKYEYMKEYETNGVRPNLDSDTVIEYKTYGSDVWSEVEASEVNWKSPSIKKFRIVDERFKPEANHPKFPEMDLSEAKLSLNNWHERGERPPVGEVVEYEHQAGNVKTRIIGHHPDKDIIWHEAVDGAFPNGANYSTDSTMYFKPIRTERDKLALKLYRAVNWNSDDADEAILSLTRFNDYRKVIDANWRPIKQQSEGGFSVNVLDILRDLPAEDVHPRQYLIDSLKIMHSAGCRFIEQGE